MAHTQLQVCEPTHMHASCCRLFVSSLMMLCLWQADLESKTAELDALKQQHDLLTKMLQQQEQASVATLSSSVQLIPVITLQ